MSQPPTHSPPPSREDADEDGARSSSAGSSRASRRASRASCLPGSGGPPRWGFRSLSHPQIRYPLVGIFYLVLIGTTFNYFTPNLKGPLVHLTQITASSVHLLISIFTELTTQRGHLVTFDGFAVAIIVECVGLLEMLIYSACVLAFPAPIRARLFGIVFGCAAIFAFNLLRIATLLMVGRYWSEYFDFFHLYFWQATLIAMIVSVLYGWIRLFVRRA